MLSLEPPPVIVAAGGGRLARMSPPQPPETSFTCPRCGKTSHNPHDAENRYCGRCHLFVADMLRMRLWIDGKLADEVWVGDEHEAEAVSARHQAIAADADAAGQLWLVEVLDPEEPSDRAHMRFGTDSAGMIFPQMVERWPWER
jgi:hypothetical protein